MIAPHPDLSIIKAGAAEARPGGVDLFTVCRNEAHLLPAFLAHYRALGVDRIYVIDNASTDDTTAVLAGMDDVWHLHTQAHYFDAKDGCDWVRAVAEAVAADRWGIFADADELLCYPGHEDITLPTLVQMLEAERAEGFFAFLLDFYSPRLFDTEPYRPGTPFTAVHRHFDGAGYSAGLRAHPADQPPDSPDLFIRGGVRHRLIDWGAGHGRPTLRKVPLAKITGGHAPWQSSHAVSRRKLSGMTGALLHFKFLGKTGALLRDDVRADGRGLHQHAYETYLTLWEDGAPNPMDVALTQTWRDSLQLVELGLCALPRASVIALRDALRGTGPRADWQPVVQRLRAASQQAEAQFRPAPGQVFQMTARY